jgi:CheY-like chemotaxis protein
MEDKNKCIAVVDDDDAFHFITSRAIKSLSGTHNVLQFFSGIEAMKYLTENADHRENLPDVLLLDLNMPILDGWMFMEEYSKIKNKIAKEISIFIVSSSIDVNDIDRAKKNKNIIDYLMKPISVEKFRELLAMNFGQ